VQGVLDTNIEVMLAAGRGTATNVAEVMVTSDPKSWALEAPDQTDVVAVKQAADSTGGKEMGWWRIDVATGDTLGIDARGWGGQAALDYVKVLIRVPLTVIGGFGCMWSNAKKSNALIRMAVCGVGSMLTINGFLLGGWAGQLLPMVGVLLGLGTLAL
jgi:hypothetical protein